MERDAIKSSLDKLATMRGDPQKGLPPTAWAEALGAVDRDQMLRAAIEAVRTLLVPDWADQRRDDRRPQAALEAAEAWLATKSADAVAQTKATAKACTAARNEFFGRDHRVPQAARSVAWAAGAKDENTHVWDAIATVEEELLARIALTTEYHLAPEKRRALVDALRRVLLPPEKAAEPAPISLDRPPVPYNADGHFELGQRITHKKFGEIVVSSVGETWIEVDLPDGTKKRLAHKP